MFTWLIHKKDRVNQLSCWRGVNPSVSISGQHSCSALIWGLHELEPFFVFVTNPWDATGLSDVALADLSLLMSATPWSQEVSLVLIRKRRTHGFLRTKSAKKISFHESLLAMCSPLAAFTNLSVLHNRPIFLVSFEQIFLELHVPG